ncbi:MAG: hypothetical protein ACLSDQ_06130 [Adlercreutzia equolifaciens]
MLFSSGADCLVALALLVSSAIGRRNPADFFRIAALYEGSICLGILGGATVGTVSTCCCPDILRRWHGGSLWLLWFLPATTSSCCAPFSFDDVVSHVRLVDTPRIVPPSGVLR